MEKEYLPDAAGVLSKKRRRRRWQKVVGALAAVVVFCTTYALILPAITEEHELVCGLEEHTHTETCYQETQRPICGLEETEGHLHSDDCYIEEPVLLCGLEETEGHVHTDDCYTEQPVLLCGQEESEDHVHSEECWGTERVLTCGQEETEPHTHSEECWGTERVLACGQEEAEPHVHTEACYETEQTLICEQEEHTHTEECYAPVEDEPESDPTADVETQADWEATLRDVTLTGEWPLDVLAVAESQLGYQESSRNFVINEDGKLKGYTRYGAWYGDPYGDWCAMFASFCLHYAEVEDFPLEANCQRWIEALRDEKVDLYREAHPEEPEEPYLPQPGDLIFFDWESGDEADHVGFVAEFIPASDGVPAQVKTLEGNAGDRVQYETYEAADSRILGYAALPEQTFYCGLPGHVHEAACYDAADELVCGFEEHIHTEECEVPPPEDPVPMELTFDGPDYSIRVQYGPEAALPEGVTLTAEEIPAGSEEYQSYYDQSLAAMGEDGGEETVLLARFFDVRFELDGEKVEPAAPVSVTVTYAEPVETGGDVNCQAVHFGKNGPELLDVETAAAEAGGTSFTHTQDGFSVIGDVVTLEAAPAGSTSHSVTFKVMIDGQWQTVGSSSYYYSGTANGPQRAYITSSMAEEVFGKYGYTATTDPGYHFGYSYDDIYTIFYANGAAQTNFCMDVDGGKIEEARVVQLYTSNSSDAQVFRVWDAGNGYSFITPIGNSSLYVNAYGYTTDDPSGTQLKLSSATNANSQWKVDTGADGRTTFWSAIAPTDQVIDLSNANMVNGGVLQLWHSTGGARYWYMVQQYRISNSTVSAQNADGTYNIGLTPESNGDIVCYYMPAEIKAAYANVAESAISTANNVRWSVTVRDDTHTVYSDGELSGMTQIVAPGGEATVTVKNANGILWSCVGATDVTSTQSGGNTTFVISNITGPVEVVATKADPSFKVQYYANVDRYVLGDSGNLEIINTSGKKLPTNSASQSLLRLTLEATSSNTNQNAGNATSLYRVKTEKRLTQMYTDGSFNYQNHPGLAYFDKLWGKPNYKLDAVLVLKDGKSPDSTNDDDWWWYQINQSTWNNITFTNLASQENAPRQEGVKQSRDGTYCILLEEGTVLRLRYETATQNYDNQASFYDYDITSGQSGSVWLSGTTGINIPSNYSREYTNSDVANVYAFGNANCETGLGLAQWSGNNINASNSNGYKGCTFGLVTGLNNGTLKWNSSILAPNLFNDGTANGKHTYNGGSLQFTQTGDTYTLTSANSTAGSRDKLEYFFNPSPSTSTTHTHIFTNNFWPMDAATNKTDPLMGAINSSGTCDIKVNGFYDEQNKVGANHNDVRVPISDDGRAHNWFFGMNFALTFTLTEDYTGPLEYIFFGDDDLWVFLDDTLICDIGGVHSSVGEYVNLRDYLPNGSTGQHTLSFFYTERGASGSTCWMSFTLPSVTSATTGQNTGSLQIAKSLKYQGDKDFSGEEYQFKVELLTKENGTALNRTYSYARSDGTYGTIKSGGTVALKRDQNITISGIPTGTYYRVTELSTEGYYTTANGKEGYIVSGTIETGAIKPASFVNTPYYELPETGGGGTLWFTLGGTALMLAAAGMYRYKKRRREAT